MKRSILKRGIGGILVAVIMLFASFTLVACSSSGERVLISGSSSVSPIMQKLAAEYEKRNKDIKIIITTSESTVGIMDTTNGNNDIGMASRAIKDTEKGLKSTKICDDGVVLIVNKEAPITNVTSNEVYNMYKSGTAIGEITSAISREEGSGTRDAFDGLIKDENGNKLSSAETFADVVSIQNNTGAVMTEIASTASKLGYISLGSLNDTVKALMFDGIEASAATIKAGTYKLARPFVLVTNESKTLKVAAQKFINFVLSEAGQKIITANGYIAL